MPRRRLKIAASQVVLVILLGAVALGAASQAGSLSPAAQSGGTTVKWRGPVINGGDHDVSALVERRALLHHRRKRRDLRDTGSDDQTSAGPRSFR